MTEVEILGLNVVFLSLCYGIRTRGGLRYSDWRRLNPGVLHEKRYCTEAAYIYYCTVRYSIMARIKLYTNPPRRGK
jgi:hypothetical protein